MSACFGEQRFPGVFAEIEPEARLARITFGKPIDLDSRVIDGDVGTPGEPALVEAETHIAAEGELPRAGRTGGVDRTHAAHTVGRNIGGGGIDGERRGPRRIVADVAKGAHHVRVERSAVVGAVQGRQVAARIEPAAAVGKIARTARMAEREAEYQTVGEPVVDARSDVGRPEIEWCFVRGRVLAAPAQAAVDEEAQTRRGSDAVGVAGAAARNRRGGRIAPVARRIFEGGGKLAESAARRESEIESRKARAAHALAKLREPCADVRELRARELNPDALLRRALLAPDGVEGFL